MNAVKIYMFQAIPQGLQNEVAWHKKILPDPIPYGF